jgi:DNA-binding CsgD family transcriptional regulator
VVANRPWLRLLSGVAATNRGDMTAAIELIQPLLEPLRAADDFLGEWLALRNLHQATNDHRGLMPRISALAAHPEFAQLRPAIQVDHHIGSAYGALYTTRWDDAACHVAKAFELATTTHDPVSAEILALHVSPFFGIIDGGLALIEAYVDHVEDRAPPGPSFVRLGLLHQRALAALFRGRFAEAADAATAGRGLLDRLGGGLIYLRTTFDWVMTTTWFASGDLHRAEQLLAQRLRDQPTADLDRAMNRLQAPMHARVLRAQGRGEQIAAIAVDMRAHLRLAPTPELGELMMLATAAQLAWANRDHDAAVADLQASVELEERLRFVPGVGSPRVDLAILLHEMGHHDDSRRHLTIALRTCETRGTPGLIAQAGSVVTPLLEDASKRGIAPATASSALSTLGSRPSPSPIVVPGSPEVLSPREVEVLRLLVGGASNRGIADALVVSEHTAKTHVRHIMSKLEVRSRAEAAARAHREHLV